MRSLLTVVVGCVLAIVLVVAGLVAAMVATCRVLDRLPDLDDEGGR